MRLQLYLLLIIATTLTLGNKVIRMKVGDVARFNCRKPRAARIDPRPCATVCRFKKPNRDCHDIVYVDVHVPQVGKPIDFVHFSFTHDVPCSRSVIVDYANSQHETFCGGHYFVTKKNPIERNFRMIIRQKAAKKRRDRLSFILGIPISPQIDCGNIPNGRNMIDLTVRAEVLVNNANETGIQRKGWTLRGRIFR